jgi:LPXTG-site transpeptidase (sortase) family protein
LIPARRHALPVAVLLVLALAIAVIVARGGDKVEPVVAAPAPTPAPKCSTADSRFVPTAVSIPGVAKNISVLALPREPTGVPGTPPLSGSGKLAMAFDLGQGIRPGDTKGNALLNAHTFPDGSALGNKLLDELEEGDQIKVHGAKGFMCYQVTDRREVAAGVYKPYFAKKGKPQIAIVVCSGQRLGPGVWTKRTLWFASPVDSMEPSTIAAAS